MTAQLLPRSRPVLGAVALGTVALGAGLLLPLASPAGATTGGVGALPPATAVAKAAAGVRRADTLVLTGKLRLATGTFAFDVSSASHGAAARGVFVSHSPSVGFVGRIDFVERRGAVYLHAGRPFWAKEVAKGAKSLTAVQKATAAHLLASHWIEMTGTSARAMEAGIGPLTRPSDFAAQLLSGRTLGRLRKGRLTHLRGKLVVPITSSKGGTLYVAARGPVRPVALVTKTGAGHGTVLFSYPAHLAVSAPARSRTVAQVVNAVAG